jgi:hypothetical protein
MDTFANPRPDVDGAPAAYPWRGVPRRVSNLRGPLGSILTRLHTLCVAASNTREPILPHSHRRATKKIANNTTNASSTNRMTSKGNGISPPAFLPRLPEPRSDRLQGVPE